MASSSHDYTRDDVDYDSTNEEDEETRKAKRARKDLADKPRTDRREKAKAGRSVFTEEAATEEGRRQRFQLSKLNAYDRHKQLINTYQVSPAKDLIRQQSLSLIRKLFEGFSYTTPALQASWLGTPPQTRETLTSSGNITGQIATGFRLVTNFNGIYLDLFGKRRRWTRAGRCSWPSGTMTSCSRNTVS